MVADNFQMKDKRNSSLTLMIWKIGRAVKTENELAGVPVRAPQDNRYFLTYWTAVRFLGGLFALKKNVPPNEKSYKENAIVLGYCVSYGLIGIHY